MSTPVDLASEAWLIRRLGEHGRHVEDGVTDVAIRRERIRAAIIEGGLEAVVAGDNSGATDRIGRGSSGKPETYREVFARLYGEPLERSARRGNAA